MSEEQAQVKESVAVIPVVVNTADDPRDMSVTSIGAFPESVDRVGKEPESQPKEKTEPVADMEKKESQQAETQVKQPDGEEPDPKKTDEPKPSTTAPLKKEKDDEQHRINVITKARREAERLAETRAQTIKELEDELKKAKSQIPAKDKPKLDDFESEAEFMEALADWKVDQRLREKNEQDEKATRETTEKQAIDREYEALDGIMEKGRTKYADFNTLVLDEALTISQPMVEVILFSDVAEDLYYYLGKNPDESARIAKLPPMKAAHEIGKIEAKLTAPPPPPPPKKLPQAPDPITPVKTTGAIEKDPNDMTPREYREWREKQKR